MCSDPDGDYRRDENSNLVERRQASDDPKYIVRGYFPFIPNIRDGNGHLIMPHEYEDKLEDGTIVMINVELRMYVLFKLISFY
jgi:hypothetical protein